MTGFLVVAVLIFSAVNGFSDTETKTKWDVNTRKYKNVDHYTDHRLNIDHANVPSHATHNLDRTLVNEQQYQRLPVQPQQQYLEINYPLSNSVPYEYPVHHQQIYQQPLLPTSHPVSYIHPQQQYFHPYYPNLAGLPGYVNPKGDYYGTYPGYTSGHTSGLSGFGLTNEYDKSRYFYDRANDYSAHGANINGYQYVTAHPSHGYNIADGYDGLVYYMPTGYETGLKNHGHGSSFDQKPSDSQNSFAYLSPKQSESTYNVPYVGMNDQHKMSYDAMTNYHQ